MNSPANNQALALSIVCPACGAEVGKPCLNKLGRKLGGYHMTRGQAAGVKVDVPKPKALIAPVGQLDASKLYFGDNGQVFCGTLACAGASAFFSGRTISGQRVELVTESSNAYFKKAIGKPACCESCKKEFRS